jgi:hypothetical protein
MHVPLACPVTGGAYAEYFALGDFDPASPPAKGHFLSDQGAALTEIDPATRALVVHAGENDRMWIGSHDIAPAGDVDVLLLPALASCGLTASVGTRAGSILSPISSERSDRVLVVGGDDGTSPSPSYVARLDTGEVQSVFPDLLTPRTSGATATPFAGGALVSGGVRPDGVVLDKAEVYDEALGGFDQAKGPISLSEPRADHGAAVLATGETLLVGGVGVDGKTVLSSLEIVDPKSRTVRAEGVARLAVARRNAQVLRLASGEIFVAGGFDANGPVTRLEWFTPDASAQTRCSADLVAGSAHSYAALPAGGALAVVAPPTGASPGFQNTWVIDADCAVEPAAPVEGALTQPALFGAAGGAPALWTGDRWLRWEPWSGAFVALGALDDVPARIGNAKTSPDPGLALWLDAANMRVTALRFDERGEYSTVPASMLVADASETAPDRLAASGVVAFDSSLGGLVLAPGASAFVTDRAYADVAVDVEAPTGEPALVVLRDEAGRELEVGGASCPGSVAPGAASIHVERRGGTVAWSVAGGPSGTCATGVAVGARLALGLRGASGSGSVARDLRVVRLRAP